MIKPKLVKPVKKTLKQKPLADHIVDLAWGKRLRDDAKGICEYCGITHFPNAHHIFSRRNWSVRWELDNGICLCSKHHTFSPEFSAHLTPMEFAEWIKEKRGEEWYEKLRALKMQNIKKSSIDKRKVLAELRMRYET